MSRQTTMIPIRGEILKAFLSRAQLGQYTLGEKLGVTRKTINEWLNTNKIPPQRLLSLTMALGLSPKEHSQVLGDPFSEMVIQFRTSRNVKVPSNKDLEIREVAKDFFKLDDASIASRHIVRLQDDDPKAIANSILKELGLSADSITFDGTLKALERCNIFVLFFDFGDELRAVKAQAACAQFGTRSVIFIDSNEALEDLTWRLFHELCHLFCGHNEVTAALEKFCNDVATEIVTPTEFFQSNKPVLKKKFSAPKSHWPNMIKSIARSLSASSEGIVLALVDHKIIDETGKKYLYGCLALLKKDRLLVSSKIHPPTTYPELIDFWLQALKDPDKMKFLELQNRVQAALVDGRMSIGRAADLLKVDEKAAEELKLEWQKETIKVPEEVG